MRRRKIRVFLLAYISLFWGIYLSSGEGFAQNTILKVDPDNSNPYIMFAIRSAGWVCSGLDKAELSGRDENFLYFSVACTRHNNYLVLISVGEADRARVIPCNLAWTVKKICFESTKTLDGK